MAHQKDFVVRVLLGREQFKRKRYSVTESDLLALVVALAHAFWMDRIEVI